MKALAVYAHIPFCFVKCGYCDFNTYAGLDALKPRYREALLSESDGYAGLLAPCEVGSISFGGGTPGEFPVKGLVAVVRRVLALAGRVAPDAEVSLEANPGSTSLEQLRALADGGFTRVSFGAQSFDTSELRFLDRTHSPEATAASVANARRAGFASVGLDLIYGLPGQGVAAFAVSLQKALELRPDHVSCYALTVEEGTPLSRRVAANHVPEPDPEIAAAMYELAETTLAAAGFEHYEISNWALPGHRSRHNLVYWEGGDYLGIGAGAHGFIEGERYENIAHPGVYFSAAGSGDTFVAHRYRPDAMMSIVDRVETGLRLIEGMPLSAIAGEPRLVERAVAVLRDAEAAGVVAFVGDRVALTPRGRLLHGELCARLLAAFSR